MRVKKDITCWMENAKIVSNHHAYNALQPIYALNARMGSFSLIIQLPKIAYHAHLTAQRVLSQPQTVILVPKALNLKVLSATPIKL